MLRSVWRNHPWATAILALACLAALVFAIRLAVFTLYWSDPAHRNAPIEGWMTPGYVAMSWRVPKPVVLEMLALEERAGARLQLKELAAERGVPLDQFISDLQAALIAEKANAR